MSKIITKRQLNLVIENTLKEVGNVLENEGEIRISEEEMNTLENEGTCMCGDKCIVYHEDDTVVDLITKISPDCIILTKEQMDMLHNDGKCDCNGTTLVFGDEVSENEEMEEGNEFTGALADAKEKGKNEFEVDGKKYKVEEVVSESINGLTESLIKTTNNKLLKEDLNFFNKMVNYNK